MLQRIDGRKYGFIGNDILYIGRKYDSTRNYNLAEKFRFKLDECPLSNPYVIDKFGDRKTCNEAYRDWLIKHLESKSFDYVKVYIEQVIIPKYRDSKTYRLSCWCKQDEACHGDIIIELIETYYGNKSQLIKQEQESALQQRINQAVKNGSVIFTESPISTPTLQPTNLPYIDTNGFTDSQKIAIAKLQLAIENNETFALSGMPGTGKTYTLTRFLASYQGDYKLLCCAKTHKATSVLDEFIVNNKLNADCRTVASAFKIQPDKRYRNKKTGEIPFRQTKPVYYDDDCIVVIDEYSNLTRYEFMIIQQSTCKLILLGDINQLPSVGDKFEFDIMPDWYGINESDNIVNQWITLNPDNQFTLTEVKRYDGDLLIWAEKMCQNIKATNIPVWQNGNQFKVHRTNIRWKNTALDVINNTDINCKIITYRNELVSNLNTECRLSRYGDDALEYEFLDGDDICVGSSLKHPITDNKLLKPVNRPEVYANNKVYSKILYNIQAQMKVVEVLSISPLQNEFIESFYSIYSTGVIEMTNKLIGLNVFYDIDYYHLLDNHNNVLHPIASVDLWLSVVAKVYKACKVNKLDWECHDFVVDLNDYLTHCYAITADSAQGSTYDITFVHNQDIMNNTDIINRNKRLYVAVTRTRSECHVI